MDSVKQIELKMNQKQHEKKQHERKKQMRMSMKQCNRIHIMRTWSMIQLIASTWIPACSSLFFGLSQDSEKPALLTYYTRKNRFVNIRSDKNRLLCGLFLGFFRFFSHSNGGIGKIFRCFF